MSDVPSEVAPPPARRPAWRWQLGVRGLILLVVVAALGASIAANRRRIADLTARVDRMRPMVRDLEVDDPTRFAAIELDEPWSEDITWDVYLPPGRRYRVALATRAVDDDAFPAPLGVRELAPGRHRLALVDSTVIGEHALAVRDGPTRVLAVAESPSWAEGSTGWSGSSLDPGKTTQRPIDRPLQLTRRRYQVPAPNPNGNPITTWTNPTGPSDGVLLWVEAIPEAGPSPPAPAPSPAPPGR